MAIVGEGLNEATVREISAVRGEPAWMLNFRLESLHHFAKQALATSNRALSEIIFDDIAYTAEPAGHRAEESEDEAAFKHNRRVLESQGVIFCAMHTALTEYPEIVKPYFGRLIAPQDDKFAAVNSAVWTGGSFIYIPPGIEVKDPLQVYSRGSAQRMDQFERTLIIADAGSKVDYIEGCAAPVYTSDSLRSAAVEVVVKPGARVSYTTIQNWSQNVVNLVTKRAHVEAEGHMEWIDGNIGSRITHQQPAIWLAGPQATGEVLSVAYAGAGQYQDIGPKVIHAAPETTSKIVSKSISKDQGRSIYRGTLRVEDEALGCSSRIRSDALILDDGSTYDDQPEIEIGASEAQIRHDKSISKVASEQLFYLTSRGLSQEQSLGVIVNGFIQPVTRRLPMEYAVEWSRLIELQMEGAVG